MKITVNFMLTFSEISFLCTIFDFLCKRDIVFNPMSNLVILLHAQTMAVVDFVFSRVYLTPMRIGIRKLLVLFKIPLRVRFDGIHEK